MKHIAKLVALASLSAFAAASHAVTDDFNRYSLGPDWVMHDGIMWTDGAVVHGHDYSLMTYTPGAGAGAASVDVILDGSGSIQYGAIVLGFLDPGHNAFIKLQNNHAGNVGFDTLGFYYGNNGGGDFRFITGFENVTSARITASLAGSVSTLSIDANFDGIADAVYTHDYGSASFGSGVGLGIYGRGTTLDNFDIAAVPEPQTYALMLAGLLAVSGAVRRRARRG